MTKKPSMFDTEKRILRRYPYPVIVGSLLMLRLTSMLPVNLYQLCLMRTFLKMSYRVAKKLLHCLNASLSNLFYTGRKWQHTQELYVKWTKSTLPPQYLNEVRIIGRKFAEFIQYPVRSCLDVGCGNGLINGVTYKQANFFYMTPNEYDYVQGIDPLPLEGILQPWLTRYTQYKFEDTPSLGWDTVVFATSLDHMEYPDQAILKAYEVLHELGKLYIWVTCRKIHPPPDIYHMTGFTKKRLRTMIENAGFHITKEYAEPFGSLAETVFIQAVKVKQN